MGTEGIEPPAGGVTSQRTGAAYFTIKLCTHKKHTEILFFNLSYPNRFISLISSPEIAQPLNLTA